MQQMLKKLCTFHSNAFTIKQSSAYVMHDNKVLSTELQSWNIKILKTFLTVRHFKLTHANIDVLFVAPFFLDECHYRTYLIPFAKCVTIHHGQITKWFAKFYLLYLRMHKNTFLFIKTNYNTFSPLLLL